MKRTIALLILILTSTICFSQKISTADEIKSLKDEVSQNTQKIRDLELKVTDLKIDIERVRNLLIAMLNSRDTATKQNTNSVSSSETYSNSNSSSNQVNTKTSPVGSYGQCKAITQKKTRCSRNAKANGYCWQHGG